MRKECSIIKYVCSQTTCSQHYVRRNLFAKNVHGGRLGLNSIPFLYFLEPYLLLISSLKDFALFYIYVNFIFLPKFWQPKTIIIYLEPYSHKF
ncbi:hypothetical protein BpHYR1_023307 [Brachionus plicatilis]|uniref:Uncharacterized protein n=1 Tax=Brachionus plicatilis TaxID=10195 RepID=A0A3M7Q7H2_BRAPC|nr:hypothetical protein BpHYR1_023307 [Brachionus plicatilis]